MKSVYSKSEPASKCDQKKNKNVKACKKYKKKKKNLRKFFFSKI